MITLKKDRQFLSVIKTVKSTKTEKCIGIYNFADKKWTDEAPFVKSEMKGQKYVGCLKFLVAPHHFCSTDKEIIATIEWVDFLTSLPAIKNIMNDLPIDLFSSSYIKDMFRYNNLKKVKKELSKNNSNLKNYQDIFKILFDTIYSLDGVLGQEEWIEELYQYYNMNEKAWGTNNTIEKAFFLQRYIEKIQTLKTRYHFTEENIKTFFRIKYFQGLQKFINDNAIIEYINVIKLLEIDIPTGNFIINYRNVMCQYYDNKEGLLDKSFAKTQNEIDLHYTKDNISIFIPQSKRDCVHYGNVFSNCLGGFEWNQHLSNGDRYVVIILKDDKPTICCDIDRDTKAIIQYLGKHNMNTNDKEILDFRTDYQEYLYSL